MGKRWIGIQEEVAYRRCDDLLSENTDKTGSPNTVTVTIDPASTYFAVGMKILIIDSSSSEENTIAALPGAKVITTGTALTNDYTTANGARVVIAPLQHIDYLRMDLQPDQGRELIRTSAYRMKKMSTLNAFVGGGPLENIAAADSIGWFLKWLFGSVASAVESGTVYKHTYTVADSIKSFTMEDCRGISGLDDRYLRGCLMKALTLEAPARGNVSSSADLQYNWEELTTGTTVGTLPSLRPFKFSGAAITAFGASLGNVESFSWIYTNLIPDDSHDVGERAMQAITLEGADLTGEIDLKWLTWAVRQKYYGALVAAAEPKEPQSDERTFALVITLTGPPTDVVGYPNYTLTLTMPVITLIENPSEVVERDRLTQRFAWEALYDSGVKAELRNKTVSYEGVV